MITQEYLKSILQYNENTGEFIWLNPVSNNKIKIGQIAGSVYNNGYINITINYKRYKAHRIAWLYIYGYLPNNNIDHINGNKIDNKIENLRDVSQRYNCQNYDSHRNGKLVGASYHKRDKKWLSYIRISGKLKSLGYYNTEIEAHNAYLAKLETLTK